MLSASCLGFRRPAAKHYVAILSSRIAVSRTVSTVVNGNMALHSKFDGGTNVGVSSAHTSIPVELSRQHLTDGRTRRSLDPQTSSISHPPTLSKGSTTIEKTLDVGHARRSIPSEPTTLQDRSDIGQKNTAFPCSNPTLDPSSEYPNQDPRSKLIDTLYRTQSASEAWEAYSFLRHLPCPNRQLAGLPNIPFLHLHRLSRLLARSKPKTRSQFLRLLSVLRTIQNTGGTIHLDEWNALVHCAGRGWRKTRPEDYRLAMSVYHDMVTGRAPGVTLLENGEGMRDGDIVQPDIVTYTTLLSLAARTLHAPSVQHATLLLKASGTTPNRITHLSLLEYFTRTKQLSGVHTTLQKMKEQGLHVGLDGLNACLWAFSRNDRLDVAYMIYRVLRHHAVPEKNEDGCENDIGEAIEHLASTYGIVIPDDLVPDTITYTTMVQILAYRGHLVSAIDIFGDMLSSSALDGRSTLPDRGDGDKSDVDSIEHSPLLPAFRALFLGFARHGKSSPPNRTQSQRLLKSVQTSTADEPGWELDNLDALFQAFLALPGRTRPSRAILYWMLVAFEKTSRNDAEKLREVWSQLKRKFPGPWAGPHHRLERLRKRIFSE